jgi:hypothetical protein
MVDAENPCREERSVWILFDCLMSVGSERMRLSHRECVA